MKYQILFKDSPEYFYVESHIVRFLIEGPLIRFICFDKKGNYKKDEWYPVANIHRIKKESE